MSSEVVSLPGANLQSASIGSALGAPQRLLLTCLEPLLPMQDRCAALVMGGFQGGIACLDTNAASSSLHLLGESRGDF